MTTALKIILLLFLLAALHGAVKSTLVNARFYFGQEVAEPMRKDCLLPMIWGGDINRSNNLGYHCCDWLDIPIPLRGKTDPPSVLSCYSHIESANMAWICKKPGAIRLLARFSQGDTRNTADHSGRPLLYCRKLS